MRPWIRHARATASSSWFPAQVQLSCPSDETPSSLSGPCRWGRARDAARPGGVRRPRGAPPSRSSGRRRARPAGLFPPVSAAITIGTSGRLARAAFAVRNASATASAPSRTAMSTLGSRTASGSRSGVVSSSTSKSRPPRRKRASRRKRGSRLATRTRARGSSSSPSKVTAPRSFAGVRGAARRPGDAVADLEPAPARLAGGAARRPRGRRGTRPCATARPRARS